jgi:hypothetical protein
MLLGKMIDFLFDCLVLAGNASLQPEVLHVAMQHSGLFSHKSRG